jgi:leucyl aminopeptidase
MEKMKYDMAGAATMIGAMRAIALLKPNVKVTCIVCATENMPSGKAQKPGDIQTPCRARRSKSSIQTPKGASSWPTA